MNLLMMGPAKFMMALSGLIAGVLCRRAYDEGDRKKALMILAWSAIFGIVMEVIYRRSGGI